jgi:glycosyltransferase involved in cell wall biosynthesis
MSAPNVVILLENLPYPQDRRVRLEAETLRSAGYTVTVLAPRAPLQPDRETARGVVVRRYARGPEGGGRRGYVREYAHAWRRLAGLIRTVRREGRIDALHACSPPDLFFPFAWWLRRDDTRFVFDHHDLSPELFLAKGGTVRSPFYWALRVAERASFRASDVVLSTNEPMAEVARERGRLTVDRVFVVRTGLDETRLAPAVPATEWRGTARYGVAYVGHMDRQDGIEYVLDAAKHLLNLGGTPDVRFLLIGDGPHRSTLERTVADSGLASVVEFAGYVSDERRLAALLAAADVCVTPDPVNDFNRHCTMIKVLDYMAAGRPQVAFPLPETQTIAGEAALIVDANSGRALAEGIRELLDQPERRRRMGEIARRRAGEELLWRHSAPRLLAAYEKALGDRVRGMT